MEKIICSTCKKVHSDGERCPNKGSNFRRNYNFKNSDDYLKREVPIVLEDRRESGLEGLVGDLEFVIINADNHVFEPIIQDFLNFTGHYLSESFEDEFLKRAVLKLDNSADIMIQTRKNGQNPFYIYNIAPKSRHLPNTRLETFVFQTKNLEKFVNIQKHRGVHFLTDEILKFDNYLFIQTLPSHYIGTSFGYLQWTGDKGVFQNKENSPLNLNLKKPIKPYLEQIKYLDHTATRVRARDRDAAIIEFMELTNFKFDFAVYVKNLNSITSVTRLNNENGRFAMVFTSGITPFIDSVSSGPTEMFTYNYGTRVHHMAFQTEQIEQTYEKLKEDGMKFLIELVGGPEDGLHQTFTNPSPNSMLVNEYIHRYGDFDGFFTKSNVTDLTRSTEKQ